MPQRPRNTRQPLPPPFRPKNPTRLRPTLMPEGKQLQRLGRQIRRARTDSQTMQPFRMPRRERHPQHARGTLPQKMHFVQVQLVHRVEDFGEDGVEGVGIVVGGTGDGGFAMPAGVAAEDAVGAG
ncbi:hypothetical protein FE257_003629 [Aspergillus nanangensis]|uniref:Uncharacterized protein n=1 Tax=Aspergillus nanangensis TaxID=2582783 RepID=A0AAD4CTQ5_ASPNN|nr:hypothetical protein FE257_003629 [Aspergillus nanangensis]